MAAGDPQTSDEIYDESAWQRCWVATKARCLTFHAAAAAVLLGGLSAAGSILISNDAVPLGWRAAIAFTAAVAGFLAVFVAVLAFSGVRAPFEQRDELRLLLVGYEDSLLGEAEIGLECNRTAEELRKFSSERVGTRPSQPIKELLQERKPDLKLMLAQATHDQETRDYYEDRFAARLYRLVRSLRHFGAISEEDADKLNRPPSNLDGIDQRARRLAALGKRLVLPDEAE
jgi:hypothetical protein